MDSCLELLYAYNKENSQNNAAHNGKSGNIDKRRKLMKYSRVVTRTILSLFTVTAALGTPP